MFVLVAENTNLKTATLIDSITSTDSFYIPALKNNESIDRPDYLKNKYIDIEYTITKLSEYKII